MIQKVVINNFQSHRETVLDLGPGVNIIVGISGSGKTALFRAFEWLRTNRPAGFRFHSRFAGQKEPTEVSVLVDGKSITIKKVGNKGTYIVEGREYTGLRQDVPDEVVSLLNMSDLNVQNQHDNHFLIRTSPGEVARVLNRIIRIEEVDKWVSALTSEIYSQQREVGLLQEDIGRIKTEIKTYDNLPDMDKAVELSESLSQEVYQIGRDRVALDGLLVLEGNCSREIAEIYDFLSVESMVISAESASDVLQGSANELVDISAKVYELEVVLEKERSLNRILGASKKLEKAETLQLEINGLVKELEVIAKMAVLTKIVDEDRLFVDNVEGIVGRGLQVFDELTSLKLENTKIVQDIVKLERVELDIGRATKAVKDREWEFSGVLREMKVCPECGELLTEACIKRMVG